MATKLFSKENATIIFLITAIACTIVIIIYLGLTNTQTANHRIDLIKNNCTELRKFILSANGSSDYPLGINQARVLYLVNCI
jgi:hypothetical protein